MPSLKPERVYLVLALTFGGAFLVLTPPLQAPDEEGHFRHALAISEGHCLATSFQNGVPGDEQPRGVTAFVLANAPLFGHLEEKTSAAAILDQASFRLDPGDREFGSFYGSASYPPLPYLPQAIGVFLARRVSSSVLVCYAAGRVLNFLAATLVCYLAVRKTPVGKAGFAALALLPMTVSQSASFSPDALTNAFSFLLVAHALAGACGPEERVPAASVAVAAGLGMAVALCKPAYFLLPLCYLLIPVRKLGTGRAYAAGLAVVMASTLAAAAAWGFVARNGYPAPDPTLGVDPAKQVRWILAHPLGYLRTLAETAKSSRLYVEEYVGWLGYANLRLQGWLYVAEIALLVTAFLVDRGLRETVTARQALVAGALALLVGLTVVTAMDVAFNPVGAGNISGIQGRYFAPIGPLVGIGVGWTGGLLLRFWRTPATAGPAVLALAAPVLLSAALFRVHDRFYVDSTADAARRHSSRGETLEGEGRRQEAIAEFEEGLRVDPNHLKSRVWLGYVMMDTRPLEAIEHYRAALRIDPGSVDALNGLATLFARRGEYDEAIRYFQAALRADPQAAHVTRNLETAVQTQKQEAMALREATRVCQALARTAGAVESRRGTAGEGDYVKPNRGKMVGPGGIEVFPPPGFVWRVPPPSGGDVLLFGPGGSEVSQAHRSPFYACSAQPLLTRRVFVFPPPAGAKALPDEDVSWFYQVPLAELTAEERTKETEYRRRLGLHFPLTTLPE
jgi:uncharacterized membrane protein